MGDTHLLAALANGSQQGLMDAAVAAILRSPLAGGAVLPLLEGRKEIVDEKPMTAGEIAGRLTAKKIEPLVRYVEQVTGTKLRLEGPERPPKPDKASKPVE